MFSQLGVIGIGIMGQGIVKNLSSNKYSVSIYDKNSNKTDDFYFENAKKYPKITSYKTLEDFILSLERPRIIFLLVNAGEITDSLINSLLPILDIGDIILDMGNSYYKDTIRRSEFLSSKDIEFLGVGISGGEKGALIGPSIMVGGSKKAWQIVEGILKSMAATKPNGEKCCDYFGKGGAGHFVKMVHNGIEYAYMELLAEIYFLIKDLYEFPNEKVADFFFELNNDKNLSSYLTDLSYKILSTKDIITGNPIIDVISDVAGNKGTGGWTSIAAIELGVGVPVLNASLNMRYISTELEIRKEISKEYILLDRNKNIQSLSSKIIKEAIEFSQFICFEQGLKVIQAASENMMWGIDISKVVGVWEKGCIISTDFSEKIKIAACNNENRYSILLDKNIFDTLVRCEESARKVASQALNSQLPMPCLTNSILYFDSIRTKVLPTNFIQAQRDFFGAHTYNRNDLDGFFHTKWEDE